MPPVLIWPEKRRLAISRVMLLMMWRLSQVPVTDTPLTWWCSRCWCRSNRQRGRWCRSWRLRLLTKKPNGTLTGCIGELVRALASIPGRSAVPKLLVIAPPPAGPLSWPELVWMKASAGTSEAPRVTGTQEVLATVCVPEAVGRVAHLPLVKQGGGGAVVGHSALTSFLAHHCQNAVIGRLVGEADENVVPLGGGVRGEPGQFGAGPCAVGAVDVGCRLFLPELRTGTRWLCP